MKELIALHIGIVLGWLIRYQRGKKIFDKIRIEVENIKKLLNI